MRSGLERVAPGVYVEERTLEGRVLHLDLPELLVAYGVGDTEKNRDLLAETATRVFKARFPKAPIPIVERHE